MPTMIDSQEQYPILGVGPKSQHAFLGFETLFFTGATGLIGTAYGIPGVTATRVATGAYRVNYQSLPQGSGAMGVIIMPGLNAPTGNFYNVNITDVQSVTGVAHIEITQRVMMLSGAPTNMLVPVNPASGTRLHLQFFGSPVTPF